MLDLTDIPTTTCVCGNNVFKTLVALDPATNLIGWYTMTGYCINEECGARVTFPDPVH